MNRMLKIPETLTDKRIATWREKIILDREGLI